MALLALVLALGVIAGLGVALAMRRWPARDPAAPRLSAQTLHNDLASHPRLAAWARSRRDPNVATGLLLSAGLLLLTLGISAAGLLLLMVHTHTGFATFDASAARFGATHATHRSTTALRLLTQPGGAVVLLPVTVIVAGTELLRQARRPLSVLAFLALAVGGQFLVVNGVKSLVHRARPALLHLTGFSGSSFPSGHAAAAAASFAAFALVLGRGRSRRVRTWLAAGAVGLAVSISTTRVLLGVHWLTDVLAGLAIGWAWFALASMAFGGRLLDFAQPVVLAEQVAQPAWPASSRRDPARAGE